MFKYIVVACLLLLLQGLTINHCALCNTHTLAVESPFFYLSLDYSALDQSAANSSQTQILWNGYEQTLLVPQNKSVLHFAASLRVTEGTNNLTIFGVNGSTGAIIDNVRLTRQGNQDNIIDNGDFEKIGNIFNLLKGSFVSWTGHSKSINTKSLNQNWNASTAALVLPGSEHSLIQTFNFDRQSRLQTENYTLTFDYAAKSGAPLNSTTGVATWNSQQFVIIPKDYEVHSVKALLKPKQNRINVLTFKGTGLADGLGLTISNVKILALSSSVNMVLNGDFSMPVVVKGRQDVDFLPGWDLGSKSVTIGQAKSFNKWWPHTTRQVLTLDSHNQNAVVGQQFNIGTNFTYLPKETPFFDISFDYAALDEQALNKSAGELLWNEKVLSEFTPEDWKVQTFHIKMSFKPGPNKFTFRATKGKSILVSNFQVKRLGLKDNLCDNGDFALKTHQGLIPAWEGKAQIADSASLNENWKEAKVAILSAKAQDSISQTFNLSKDYWFETNRYHLELEMAPTEEAELDTQLAVLTWNGQEYPLKAISRKVQKFRVEVAAVRGPNLITLSGQGDDGKGLTVDNIKLIPFGASMLAIKNGNFQGPKINREVKTKVLYTVPEWEGENIEIGFGDNYNKHWAKENDQVLSLATKKRTNIYQVLIFSELAIMGVQEPNLFILSFHYTALEDKPLEYTGGEVYWNKQLVGEFVPTSYNITFYSVALQANTGSNTLFIKAAGGLETYGLTLKDIKLVRQGSEDNIIEDGDFQATPTPGWSSIRHDAPLPNHQWATTWVGHIDAKKNLFLIKTFEFDSYYRYKTDKLNLLVSYAVREGSNLENVGATISWNNRVEIIKPTDLKVHSVKIPVIGIHGENKLKFEGQGLTLDNIRLIPLGSVSNVLPNGDFEIPHIDKAIQKLVPSSWNGYQDLEFGNAYLFSKEWAYSNGQVVSLTKRNQFLSQVVTIESTKAIVRPEFPFFKLSLEYAAADDGETEIGEIYWNGKLVKTLEDEDDINHCNVKVVAQSGKNTLQINKKNQGLAFTNIRLVRYGLDESIVKNGDFKGKANGAVVPHWLGNVSLDASEEYSDEWEGRQVAVLDGESISQEFEFDGSLRLITQDYVVSFQYGVRQGVNFEAAKAKMYWNNDLFNFHLQDHSLHQFKKTLQGRVGNNNLTFESEGQKRTFGIFAEGFDIGYISVRPFGSGNNVLKNKDFDSPRVVGFSYGMFTSHVPGWITQSIYIGVGHYFGPEWGEGQILELSGEKKNAKIMQTVRVNMKGRLEL